MYFFQSTSFTLPLDFLKWTIFPKDGLFSQYFKYLNLKNPKNLKHYSGKTNSYHCVLSSEYEPYSICFWLSPQYLTFWITLHEAFLITKFIFRMPISKSCALSTFSQWPRTSLHFFFFYFILFYFLTLQYCIGFAIYQHESTTGIHVFHCLTGLESELRFCFKIVTLFIFTIVWKILY